VEPLEPERHAAALFAAFKQDERGAMWTYLPYGPFASLEEFHAWLEDTCMGPDPLFHAIVATETRVPLGQPKHGVIEVGHLLFSPQLQRTLAATEAMYLMMRRAFELGYRRYEWKCDALNAPSRAAAQRLGFSYEGLFRQAVITKGRNRDTAWYSVIDCEWPALRAAFERWLAPDNFDAAGRQRVRLSELTAARLHSIS
jgi:RimJ/RimL family protein N-acetyltransferase